MNEQASVPLDCTLCVWHNAWPLGAEVAGGVHLAQQARDLSEAGLAEEPA